MTKNLKTTPLNKWHRSSGANMADFGGFEMPLWYKTGVKNEHLAVLKSAGLFDTSHMACINVSGIDSFKLINFCFTRDIATLKQGRCIYGAFLNSKGHCIDDAIVYKFNDVVFMICVNAGMGLTIAQHLNAYKTHLKLDAVNIEELSQKIGKIDIQGINSARILSKIIKNPDKVFDIMPYFSFKGNLNQSYEDKVTLLDETPILLSRSGYTGEFGFEIFLHSDALVSVWQDILSAGEEFGIIPCGLGARDSLRTGACLPLSHQDIGDWKFSNHPWDFALPYNKDKTSFTKDFLGSDALISSDSDSLFTYPFVGESLRKVVPGDNTIVIEETEKITGKVLTCVTDMGITWHKGKIASINSENLPQNLKIKGLSCGFLMISKKIDPEYNNTKLTLKEGKREIIATIVKDIRPDRTARKKINNFI